MRTETKKQHWIQHITFTAESWLSRHTHRWMPSVTISTRKNEREKTLKAYSRVKQADINTDDNIETDKGVKFNALRVAVRYSRCRTKVTICLACFTWPYKVH